METSLESILREAVNFEAQAFDGDQEISGAEVVEWFSGWRRRARRAMRSIGDQTSAPMGARRVHDPLLDALHALQTMLDGERDGVSTGSPQRGESSRCARYETDTLRYAINHGGLQLTAVQFRIVVFKRPTKEVP